MAWRRFMYWLDAEKVANDDSTQFKGLYIGVTMGTLGQQV